MLDVEETLMLFALGGSIFVGFVPFIWHGCAKKPSSTEKTVTKPHSRAQDLKPKEVPRNAKEEMIARGELQKDKGDYPTMDDVVSDWSSEDDGDANKKKKTGKNAKKVAKNKSENTL